MSSQHPEDDVFLFDSIQDFTAEGTSDPEDSFESPFVEEDPDWLKKLLERPEPSTPASAGWDASSSYTILSRQEASSERVTDRVSRETAATVQSALGTAGMAGTTLHGKTAAEPAARPVTAATSGSADIATEYTHRVPAPVRKARMVSGAARPAAPDSPTVQEPAVSRKPADPEPSVRNTAAGSPAPASSTARTPAAPSVPADRSDQSAGTAQKSVPVTEKAASGQKTKTAKKKGGAHVAPKKSRFGLRKTEKAEKPAVTATKKKPAAPASAPAPSRPKAAPPRNTAVNARPRTAAAATAAPTASAPAAKPVRTTAPAKKTSAPAPPVHPRPPVKTAPQKRPAAAAGKNQAVRKKKNTKKKRRTRFLVTALAILVFLEIGYGLFVYSNIPFFEKWRTIYIETAMSTLNHQWLATKFIPEDIINDVMKDVEAANAGQKNIKTSWKGVGSNSNARVVKKSNKASWFYDLYWEIDQDSFEDYLDDHESLKKQGYNKLVINNLDDKDERLKTKFGEAIRVLDVPENLLIVEVTGGNYVGSLAICKNADQITMKKAQDFGDMGDQILSYTKKNVLAINGSGFQDPNGEGLGGTIVGSFVLNGKEYGKPEYNYLFFGYRNDNRLYINWGIEDFDDYKWGLQFAPALIVNGETIVEGTNGWGLQPRTAIGQTEEGEFLLLIVDGRQVGYSLGCTVADCASIMERHEAYQAVNMDGGSSSIMAYRDRIITRNSSALPEGRYLPNAIVVQPAEDVEGSKKKDND